MVNSLQDNINLYSELKIAVIGCGNWGKNHVRVLHQLGALYAVSDRQSLVSEGLSSQYKVLNYSIAQIIEDKNIHGVVIATPAETHTEIAIQCLKAGKHLFVEKPIALTMHDSQLIYDQAVMSGKILMVGHLLHYHAGFQALKALSENGTFGKLQYIYANRLNLGKFRTEEDIWWSYAPHDVSMILGLMNQMPTSVIMQGSTHLQHTLLDVSVTHLNFKGGEQAHIFASWLHPFKEQKLVVVGDKAMAIFDDTQAWENKLKLYPYPAEWQDGLPKPVVSDATPIALPLSEPLKNEVCHYLDCILNKKTPITDGEEALRVMQVLLAAESSLKKNQSTPALISSL